MALFFLELLDNLLVPGGKRAVQGTHGVNYLFNFGVKCIRCLNEVHDFPIDHARKLLVNRHRVYCLAKNRD